MEVSWRRRWHASWRADTVRRCADATVGLGRLWHVTLAFSREAMDRHAVLALAVAQMVQVLPGASLVKMEAGSP
ncbi:hypothetical protein WK40_16415 [Burkholderia cepacia]|nr:hypothetical protein WK40_16415 [Burkholderia cepacia]